jgi:SAM-dependent methyltransferase
VGDRGCAVDLMEASAVETCRSCGAGQLEALLDLGSTALANELPSEPGTDQIQYPLGVVLCSACSLVQSSYRVPGRILFGQGYPYFSSVSPAYLAHARENALELIETRALGQKSLVVEVASNDGYLLKNFVEKGIPVLGIDPAEGPAAAARDAGVPTSVEYFGSEVAARLREEEGPADLILGNNVMAHVDDVNDLAAGVAALLHEDGVGVFEAPYVVDLVDRCAFDTIYHEHNCYFSLTALKSLFERHGLGLQDVRRLKIHGGSLRIFVGRSGETTPAVESLLASERERGVDSRPYYDSFSQRVTHIVQTLGSMLREFNSQGKLVAAYGAAAKGSVISSVAGFGPEDIAYVVDRNPHKQGRYMPGGTIPIVPPERLESDPPDYLLLFAWNLADEIRSQLPSFKGRYIVPIPEPRIL